MTAKPRIILTRLLPKPAMEELDRLNNGKYEVVTWEKDAPAPPREWVLENIKGAYAVILMVTEPVNQELCDAAGSQLKVVSTMSAGFDHVQLPELKKRSIRLGVTPDVLTDAVAETTVMLVLSALRRGSEAIQTVLNGEWPVTPWSPTAFCGYGLTGATVGVIGFGRIAQASVSRLLPFGIKKVVYTTSKPNARASNDYYNLLDGKNAYQVPIEPATSIDEVAQVSDVILVLANYSPETHHIINKEFLQKTKKNAVVVNTGRGPLIDTNALAEALETEEIFAAGLDVLENEPNITKEHPLVKQRRAVLLPHIGSATIETRTRMAKLAVQNAFMGLEGKEMKAEKVL